MDELMDKDIIKVAKLLNQEILKSKEYQNYINSKNEIENLTELHEQEEMLKKMQKKLVNYTFNNDDQVEKLRKLYKQTKDDFQNHPIVCNYILDLELLNELLQYINQYLNGALK